MKTMEELKWEEQLLFWENESKAFEAYLSADSKLKAETIHKHGARISFLTKEYFVRYEITYDDLDGETIVDFLGRFLISRVLNSSASDMSANLTSLKKWIQFLLQTEKITKDQYAGLYEVCKQKVYFEERFEQYMSANSDFALERWFNSNDIRPYLKPSKASKRNPKPYEVDQKLLQLWMDGKTSVPRIVAEFRAFLEAVQAGSNVKLSAARQHLPRKFWKELDEALNLQLFRKPTLNQDQEPVFQFFFYAAVVLEIADEGTILSVNPKQLANYLALTEQEQAALLLDTLWNKLNWGILEEVNEGGRPEDIQAWRRATASVLASWPVGQEHNVSLEWKKHQESGILLNTFTDVFLHAVATVLVRFDLIKAQYPPEAEMKYAFLRQPAWMTVLDSGNRVFRYFVNEAAYVLGNTANGPATSEPKIGRNDTCPCGSGKKYKKCCL